MEKKFMGPNCEESESLGLARKSRIGILPKMGIGVLPKGRVHKRKPCFRKESRHFNIEVVLIER